MQLDLPTYLPKYLTSYVNAPLVKLEFKLKKKMGFRNMQEKLEKKTFVEFLVGFETVEIIFHIHLFTFLV